MLLADAPSGAQSDDSSVDPTGEQVLIRVASAPTPPNVVTRILSDSLFRNSAMVMATTAINSGFGYFYWMFAAHLFHADEVGRASAVIAAMNLTALVANLGLPTALIGLLPRQKTNEQKVSLVVSSFAVAVLSCTVLGIAVGLTM